MIDKFDSIQGKLTAAMLQTVAKASILVKEADFAARAVLQCSQADLELLLKSTDASITSITAASIPWNRHRGFVAAAHAVKSTHQRGLRVGTAADFSFEAALVGFNESCGATEARLRRSSSAEWVTIPVVSSGPRGIVASIPSLPAAGLYEVEIGYPASGGFLNSCENELRVVTATLPASDVASYSVGFRLTPSCTTTSAQPKDTEVYIGNNDCDNGRSGENYINLSDSSRCRFQSVGTPKPFNGGGDARVRQEASRVVLSVSVGNAWCRKVLGKVVNRRGVSAGYRLHATEVCTAEGVRGPAITGSSGKLRSGQGRSTAVSGVTPGEPPFPGASNAADCAWVLESSVVVRQGRDREVADNAPVEGKGRLDVRTDSVQITWSPATATVTSTIVSGQKCDVLQ